MNYYILANLAVFGLFLMALGVTIVIMERKARRYAVPASDEEIKKHQQARKVYMLTHGGLPVDMRRVK